MFAPDPTLLSQRPQMPTPEDEARSIHQRSRLSLLLENWDELAGEWNETRVDVERLAQWGLPDTSSNVVADVARQLSTPGLYGSVPTLGHADPTAQLLIGPGGYLDKSKLWQLMQHVQYITTGLSDMFVALDVVDRQVVPEPVYPHDIYLVWHPTRRVVVGLWRLRLRRLPDPLNTWVWAWDQWDLGEREEVNGRVIETRPPSFRIVGASGEWKGQALTNLFVRGVTGDALEGEAFKWRFADGTPFVPYVRYVDMFTGIGWNWTHRRGAMRGAMNAMTGWTYVGHAAQDASGRTVIAWGLQPMGANVKDGGTAEKVRHIQLSPGSIAYHEIEPGAQPGVQEVGPGANVKELLDYALQYEAKQLRRWGIDEAGAEKGASDPASGAAKFVSRQQKREIADRVRPLYMASDLEVVAIAAALLRIAGLQVFPESGYSISHAPIPKTADEMAADRDQIEWEQKQGMTSRIEAYRRTHPGTTAADAKAALVRAAVENAELDEAVAAAMADAGLTKAPETDPNTRVTIALTSTDIASIVTVDEARASQGLPAKGGTEGALTVAAFQARNAATIAAAANAAKGEPAPADANPTP